MAQLDELIVPLAMRVAKVPNFVAINALRFAAQQFAQQSLLWSDTQSITATGAASYTLTPPVGAQIAAIVGSSLDGKPLVQGADYELDGDQWCAIRDIGSGAIKVLVAFKTARDSTLIGDVLLDHYTLAIASGAAAYLGAQENQAWSLSKLQLQLFQDEFETGYQDARKRALNKANRLYEAQTKHQFY